MRRLLLLTIVLFSAICCSIDEQHIYSENKLYSIQIENDNTKSSIDGNTISFSNNDIAGVYISNVCENKGFFYNSNNACMNTYFSGDVQAVEDASFVAYYPWTSRTTGNNVYVPVFNEQKYPFDPSANAVYTEMQTADFNPDGTGAPSFIFKQLLGLIKITFSNKSDGDEFVQQVRLESSNSNTRLTSDFSYDISDPLNEDKRSYGESYPYVTSICSSTFALGTEQHEVYLFVNCCTLPAGSVISISTDKNVYKIATVKDVDIENGNLTVFPEIDLSSEVVSKSSKKSLVCWGDSFTNYNFMGIGYPNYLKVLLKGEWNVYDGGNGGHRTGEIASRQGGIQLCCGSAFTIPADCTPVSIDGLYIVKNTMMEDEYYRLRDIFVSSTPLLNPCMINGVLCTVTYNSVKRLTPGEAVKVESHTPIYTYGQRELRQPDLMIVYMGANGGWGERDENNKLISPADVAHEILLQQHNAMIDYNGTGDYIVLGRHNSKDIIYNGKSVYLTPFENQFGRRFIDMREEVNQNALGLLRETGAYGPSQELEEGTEDYNRVQNGFWPVTFNYSATDSHPGLYGAKAMAIVIYNRMKELGYVD